MPRPRNLLNVRTTLERIVRLRDELPNFEKYGLELPPLFKDELLSIALIARATLNKHTHTRKDVRIERKS
jgi:hypothetical protein